MKRVEIKPEMIRWARDRAGLPLESLTRKFPRLPDWEEGTVLPTLKQLEGFSRTVHVPFGFLFLTEPPVEKMPVADFRTLANRERRQPSPDLLDTIYLCQQRQEWYRDFARTAGEGPRDFVGSVAAGGDVIKTATQMRERLEFAVEDRATMPSSAGEALRELVSRADRAGILVMVSGVVGSNNTRKLDPGEFRGFALVDTHAPLVFINGSDSKAAQFFTLAHELAHLWAGESAVSDASLNSTSAHRLEKWCNSVAAEFLVPLSVLGKRFNSNADLDAEVRRLSREFRVSTLVIIRRLLDHGAMDRATFEEMFRAESARLKKQAGKGGNFYHTLGARTSRRFEQAVVVSAVEGRSSFTEAFRLLGLKKMSTFRKIGAGLGIRF